jgi:SAM-dependent methyltransferase
MSNAARIGAAYDAIAADYDRQIAGGLWMRRALWRHFAGLFGAGARVLDAGCGTGADTLHLAARGVRVTAIDASANMVAALRAKLAGTPLAAAVEVQVGDLDQVVAALEGPFDGIISSFAALNTVDLVGFAAAAARLVRPGGRLVLHLLSPGDRPGAAAPSEQRVVEISGQRLPHLSLPAAQVHDRFFAAHFVLRRAYALGFLVRRAQERWLPLPLLDLLGRLEALVGAVPAVRGAGRFFVLDLERRASPR